MRKIKDKHLVKPSEITPLVKDDFLKNFSILIDRLWTIQDRINELKEFEKQWEDVFQILRDKTGYECKIHIRSINARRTYRWDKYQVLISDLYSICKNELNSQNENAVIRQSIHHAKLFEMDKYINNDKKIHFIDNPRYKISEERKKKILEESKIEDANRTVKYIKESLNNLFPKIENDYVVRDQDIKHLMARINSISDDIRGIRNYFNHKYEDSVTEKYESHLSKFSIEKIEEISDKIFSIISDLGLVISQTSYSKSEFDHVVDISNQIDIILFGTIHSAIYRFYEDTDKDQFYWEARKKYFNSDKILEIISKN